jgi:hypothetical protein
LAVSLLSPFGITHSPINQYVQLIWDMGITS